MSPPTGTTRMKKQKISQKVLKDYYLENLEWNCPRCGAEVTLLHSKSRPDLKGMYCRCRQWGGRADELLSQEAW
jgi:hypothetical protein